MKPSGGRAAAGPLAWMRRALFMGLGLAVMGQAPTHPKISDAVAWTPQGWLMLPFMPGSPAVLEDTAHLRRAIRPPAGEAEGNEWTARSGLLYFIGANASENRVALFRMDLGATPGAWDLVGRLDSLQHGLAPVYLFPLDQPNRFLGLSWMGGFTDSGKASFAAVFRLSGGSLEFDALVDMPFDGRDSIGRFVPAGAQASKGAGTCEALSAALEPTLWASIATDRYAFLAASQGGVLWAFDLKDGHCAKAINLAGFEWKELPAASLMDHFILAAEPDQNGDLIVATRDPEITTLARVFSPNPASGKEALAKARLDFNRAALPFGGVRWWVVDGKTLEARPATGDRFPQVKGLDYGRASRFKFLVDADGQILTSLGGHWNEFLDQLAHAPSRGGDPAPARKKVK